MGKGGPSADPTPKPSPDLFLVLKTVLSAILYCACAQTATSQLPIKILTWPLDSASPISSDRATVWRSDDVFTLRSWPL